MIPRVRWFGGTRPQLRRVSPEKARAVAHTRPRRELDRAGEKLAVGLAAVLVATPLLGVGAGLGARGWLGLALLLAVGFGLFEKILLELRRDVLTSLSRIVALAGLLLGAVLSVRVFDGLFGLEYGAFLPIPFVGLVIALVWNRAFALVCTTLVAALVCLYVMLHGARGTADLQGIAVACAGALVAALGAGQIKRRSTLVRIGLATGFAQAVVAGTFLLMRPELPAPQALWTLPLLGLNGLVAGLLVSGLLPAIESAFHVTTDISLLELGNTHEQPLLRKLLLEAPGTFHHSYIVGLLAEAAAEAVGGNALLARVGALYHDVGKLNKPAYFAENSPEARARHKELTPEMSMLIISAHTRDGVELGRYYGLPRAILEFMVEHHGTLTIEYFFQAAQRLRGPENVREEAFRYTGPRPRSMETAIVMLADAIEAISRQMPDPSLPRLQEMVHEVAQKRLAQRQFDECPMTLADLASIEGACVRVLQAIYHTRPTYPKGRPHPLDLSQPSEERRAARRAERVARGAGAGGPA